MHPLLSALMLTAAPEAAAAVPDPARAELPTFCNAQTKPLLRAALDAACHAHMEDARAKLEAPTAADAKCGLANGLRTKKKP